MGSFVIIVLGSGATALALVITVTSPASARGRRTDADATVGEITVGGSGFLIVGLGTLAGLLSLGLFTVLRRWMPTRSLVAGLVAAGVGGGVMARPSGLVDPDNHDFVILSPAWLAVVMAVVLLLLFGTLLVVLVDSWSESWPAPERTLRGFFATLPVVAIVLLSVLVPPFALAIVLAGLFSVYVRPRVTWSSLDRLAVVGRPLVTALGVVGGAWVVVSAVQVLRL